MPKTRLQQRRIRLRYRRHAHRGNRALGCGGQQLRWNLSSNRRPSEIYRILARRILLDSDVVIQGELPDGLRNDAEMYAGCVAGAISSDESISILSAKPDSGHPCPEPESDPDDIPQPPRPTRSTRFGKAKSASFSINVYGEKPVEPCCEPGCCWITLVGILPHSIPMSDIHAQLLLSFWLRQLINCHLSILI